MAVHKNSRLTGQISCGESVVCLRYVHLLHGLADIGTMALAFSAIDNASRNLVQFNLSTYLVPLFLFHGQLHGINHPVPGLKCSSEDSSSAPMTLNRLT